MILSDLYESHFSYSCASADKISTDIARPAVPLLLLRQFASYLEVFSLHCGVETRLKRVTGAWSVVDRIIGGSSAG